MSNILTPEQAREISQQNKNVVEKRIDYTMSVVFQKIKDSATQGLRFTFVYLDSDISNAVKNRLINLTYNVESTLGSDYKVSW
jgi:tetrahydromethanopterin S-methyltransferase subunit G